MSEKLKARYWTAVLYPESMIADWKEEIDYILQNPFAYCVHDRCVTQLREKRKEHVHIVVVFPNTTTYKNAYNLFSELCVEGVEPHKIEAVRNIRYMYDYLVHNTQDAMRKHKVLYHLNERITGNGFDIGAYEQIGVADKRRMCKELCEVILDNQFVNFGDFFDFVNANFDENYFEVIQTHSGLFERLTKSNFQKYRFNR